MLFCYLMNTSQIFHMRHNEHPYLSPPYMHVQAMSALNAPAIDCQENLIMLPPIVTNYIFSSSNHTMH